MHYTGGTFYLKERNKHILVSKLTMWAHDWRDIMCYSWIRFTVFLSSLLVHICININNKKHLNSFFPCSKLPEVSLVCYLPTVTHCSLSDYLLHIAEIQSSEICIRNILSICLCFSQSINIRVYENQHFQHLQSFTGNRSTSKREVLWVNISDQPHSNTSSSKT